jgi:hypothetical protein
VGEVTFVDEDLHVFHRLRKRQASTARSREGSEAGLASSIGRVVSTRADSNISILRCLRRRLIFSALSRRCSRLESAAQFLSPPLTERKILDAYVGSASKNRARS